MGGSVRKDVDGARSTADDAEIAAIVGRAEPGVAALVGEGAKHEPSDRDDPRSVLAPESRLNLNMCESPPQFTGTAYT